MWEKRLRSHEMSIEELAAQTGEPIERLRQWQVLGIVGTGRGASLARDDLERVRLLQLLLRRGIAPDAIAEAARQKRLERWLLPYLSARFGEARASPCTLAEAAERAGLPLRLAEHLWSIMLMGVGDASEPLAAEDVEMLGLFKTGMEMGLPEEALVQLCRVYADALGRAAEATSRLFHFYVHERLKSEGVSDAEAFRLSEATSERLRPLVAPVLEYFRARGQLRAAREDVVLHLAEEMGLPHEGGAIGESLAAILFVDLASFTPLAEAMGDLKAAEVLQRFGALVRQAADAWAGRVVKQIGDAFMLVFFDPRSAVECGLDIEARSGLEATFPALRSGIHWGPVLYREGDYVGAAVNLASRLAAEAGRHQVLVSAAVRNEVAGLGDVELTPCGRRKLKGIADEVELFEARSAMAPVAGRVVDPVCGMELGPAEIAARLSLEGQERAFCSEDCLRRFVASPERYASSPG